MAIVYTKSKHQFISEIAHMVIDDMRKNEILASVTIAQAILESGYGNSELAKEANNLFGMKCMLSGNKWPGSAWDGVTKYTKKTEEDYGTGKTYYVTSDFRKYNTVYESIEDHSAYLLGSMNGQKKRYEGLRGEKDPKKAIQIIKDGGYTTSTTYVEQILNLIRENNLTQYDNIKEEISMSNSPLVSYTKLSPNNSGKRTHAIDRITPHCVVGQCSVEALGNIFLPASRQASCNYGIGVDGRVGMYVEECNRSWCSSSNSNDQRAVTIECASDMTEPYAFNNIVYNRLIELCFDICKRNGKSKLIWINSKENALTYEPNKDEMLLTVHRWFANKSCPGDWMYARMGELASEVTTMLGGNSTTYAITASPKTYNEGDVIKLKPNSTYYNGKTIPAWVFEKTLYYRGKNENGIIFSFLKTGDITGVVKESALQ